MSFERLNRWDWVALLAALALLFTMGVDWYSTVQGEEARRIERIEDPNAGASGRSAARSRSAPPSAPREPSATRSSRWRSSTRSSSSSCSRRSPSRPWPRSPRATSRRFDPPATPSAAAAVTAAVAALLVAYRIVQQPGSDLATTIKAGVR